MGMIHFYKNPRLGLHVFVTLDLVVVVLYIEEDKRVATILPSASSMILILKSNLLCIHYYKSKSFNGKNYIFIVHIYYLSECKLLFIFLVGIKFPYFKEKINYYKIGNYAYHHHGSLFYGDKG